MSSYSLHQAELYQQMLKDGYPIEYISEYYGVTPATIRQTIHKEKHKLDGGYYNYLKNDVYLAIRKCVSREQDAVRIYNILKRNDLNSIDAIKELNDDELIKKWGVGWETICILHKVKHEILSKTKFST